MRFSCFTSTGQSEEEEEQEQRRKEEARLSAINRGITRAEEEGAQ